MTYDAFLEQMKKDLESDFSTELSAKYSGVQIGIWDAEKVQGESSNGRMTSIVTNQMMEQYGIMQEQLHQDAVENAAITHPASLRSMPKFDPDADILNLIYTIPSWISSIDRAAKHTDF